MAGRTGPKPEHKPRTPAPDAPERPANLAHGRWLGDFLRLSPAERALVACCARGEAWTPKDWDGARPEAKRAANAIRAGLIRFLALGGDAAHPVHEIGVMLRGGWIKDELDLHQCRLPVRVDLRFCKLVFAPVFIAASLPELRLSGCHMPALFADGLLVAGSLFMDKSFSATGEVRLRHAEIGSNVVCRGSSFAKPEGAALSADGAVVKGSVFFDKGFAASGVVRLAGAQIGGDLVCSDGSFLNRGGKALVADGAVIMGAFFLRKMKPEGAMSLPGVQVGTLADDRECWIGGGHVLDGLSYDRIIGPTDAKSRIAWLRTQHSVHLGADFTPQPWEQLVKVLREMGHPHEARRIAIEKQRAMRQAGIYGLPPAQKHFDRSLGVGHNLRALGERLGLALRHPARLLDELRHHLFGLLSGYGHRPWNILAWVMALWFGFAALFWGFGVGCSELIGCTANHARSALYSLDALLPVDFGMVKGSLPVVEIGVPKSTNDPVRVLSAIETLFGWIFGILVLAIVGNLVRKD